jgi:hypothetical protein
MALLPLPRLLQSKIQNLQSQILSPARAFQSEIQNRKSKIPRFPLLPVCKRVTVALSDTAARHADREAAMLGSPTTMGDHMSVGARASPDTESQMRFVDLEMQGLNPQRPIDMLKLVRLLCGWKLSPGDQPLEPEVVEQLGLLKGVLRKGKLINHEQFNEILLMLNQHRITRHFFRFFFGPRPNADTVSLEQIKDGVQKFRGYAMLCYGNFRYAFTKLASLSKARFDRAIENRCKLTSGQVRDTYRNRPRRIIRVRPIAKDKTWYIGYLSSRKSKSDFQTWLAFMYRLRNTSKDRITKWKKHESWKEQCERFHVSEPSAIAARFGIETLREAETAVVKQSEKYVREVVERASWSRLDPERWAPELRQVFRVLESIRRDVESTRSQGSRNTDVYLTWDYMDVYVATSMRERWEYEATHQFIEQVFRRNKKLRALKVRYFDPTQSYSANRIDKGLVEALMLKRAKCTLYLAQESETLGKDSELASTLAQGKPVIAYVPEIKDPRSHAKGIAKKPLDFVVKRWLQLEAEDIFTLPECLKELERNFRIRYKGKTSIKARGFLDHKNELFIKLRRETSSRTFNLIRAEEVEIRARLGEQFAEMCEILAVAEKHYFDKRAETLREVHPLAIQVNLTDGVANGVLVARNAHECAQLIYALLTNNLTFHLGHNEGEGMTELIEDITRCPYRVVTDDPKLTNSFWNFYLTGERIN